jgi:hypothetical protein
LSDLVSEGLIGNYCRNSPSYAKLVKRYNPNAPLLKFKSIYCAYQVEAGLNEVAYEECLPIEKEPKYKKTETPYYKTCAEIRPTYNQMSDSEK